MRAVNVIQERQQPYYRELQYKTQCPKHALNAVLHYLTKGNWECLINDRATASLLSNLPLDFYHEAVVQTFFPNAECRWGKDVRRAIGKAPVGEKDVEAEDSKVGSGRGYQLDPAYTHTLRSCPHSVSQNIMDSPMHPDMLNIFTKNIDYHTHGLLGTST